jgi:hypothetical protein
MFLGFRRIMCMRRRIKKIATLGVKVTEAVIMISMIYVAVFIFHAKGASIKEDY